MFTAIYKTKTNEMLGRGSLWCDIAINSTVRDKHEVIQSHILAHADVSVHFKSDYLKIDASTNVLFYDKPSYLVM